jgi:hypothetical protein
MANHKVAIDHHRIFAEDCVVDGGQLSPGPDYDSSDEADYFLLPIIRAVSLVTYLGFLPNRLQFWQKGQEKPAFTCQRYPY